MEIQLIIPHRIRSLPEQCTVRRDEGVVAAICLDQIDIGQQIYDQAADPGRRKCISGQAIAHNEDNTYRKNVQRNQQLILPKRHERIRQQSRLDRQHRQSKQYAGKREHQNCSNG